MTVPFSTFGRLECKGAAAYKNGHLRTDVGGYQRAVKRYCPVRRCAERCFADRCFADAAALRPLLSKEGVGGRFR